MDTSCVSQKNFKAQACISISICLLFCFFVHSRTLPRKDADYFRLMLHIFYLAFRNVPPQIHDLLIISNPLLSLTLRMRYLTTYNSAKVVGSKADHRTQLGILGVTVHIKHLRGIRLNGATNSFAEKGLIVADEAVAMNYRRVAI